jgi:hypothetical protein
MKQVKLNQFEAAIILQILCQIDHREVFRNDPRGSLIHYENMTRNMILTLTQLLELSQPKKKVA